jgi:hypothetical protein
MFEKRFKITLSFSAPLFFCGDVLSGRLTVAGKKQTARSRLLWNPSRRHHWTDDSASRPNFPRQIFTDTATASRSNAYSATPPTNTVASNTAAPACAPAWKANSLGLTRYRTDTMNYRLNQDGATTCPTTQTWRFT